MNFEEAFVDELEKCSDIKGAFKTGIAKGKEMAGRAGTSAERVGGAARRGVEAVARGVGRVGATAAALPGSVASGLRRGWSPTESKPSSTEAPSPSPSLAAFGRRIRAMKWGQREKGAGGTPGPAGASSFTMRAPKYEL
jgi:hypothetical protein